MQQPGIGFAPSWRQPGGPGRDDPAPMEETMDEIKKRLERMLPRQEAVGAVVDVDEAEDD